LSTAIYPNETQFIPSSFVAILVSNNNGRTAAFDAMPLRARRVEHTDVRHLSLVQINLKTNTAINTQQLRFFYGREDGHDENPRFEKTAG